MNRIYRVTSIGRPVEPKYATNKAILLLMPVAALIVGVVNLIQEAGGGPDATGPVVAFLVVFGCWALGRELAPSTGLTARPSPPYAPQRPGDHPLWMLYPHAAIFWVGFYTQ